MADTSLQIVISAKDNFSGTANSVVGSLNRINAAAGRVGKGVGQVGMGLARVGAVAGVALAGGLVFAAKQAINFEDAFAGVRKTADLTETEFTKLAGSFRKMATEIPIGADQLARLGEIAGALGISGVDNIREFSRVTALLGVTTNLSAEMAAESLGHISTILGITGKDYERFASALVDLGNKGASTEDQIAAIAERAAGGASTIGLSTQALLGWSAAIANMGVEAEAGGTNFQKFLIESARFTAEAGDEMDTLARVAGVTGAAWKKQFGADPNSALSQFVVGLGKLNTEQRILALGTLGWDDQRIARILLGLASNTGNLTAALETSGTAWQASTALQVEASKRFDTLKSKLLILKNNFIEMAMVVGEGFTPAIARAADKLTAFLGDEGNRANLRRFGEDIGKAIDSINWGEVIAGAQTFWGILKSILDVILALPTEIKAAGAAFIGLNKLSGGLIGQGVGNIAGGLASAATRGIAARVPGIGAIFAQPVYVTNWPMGGLGGGGSAPGVVPGAAAAGGFLAPGLVAAAAAAALPLVMFNVIPNLFRGSEGSGIKGDVTTKTGNVVTEGTRQTFASIMPSFEGRLAAQAAPQAAAPKAGKPFGGLSPDERQVLNETRAAGNRSYDAIERLRATRAEVKNDISLSPVTNVTVNLSWRDIQRTVTTQSRIGPSSGSAGGGRLGFAAS
jgi:TP901 family phage tail tape measure protein